MAGIAAHGVMFHHLHGGAHAPIQGSMSPAEFGDLLHHLGVENILPAGEWLARARAGALRPGELCLTFDDNLRCQYDLALPVLRDLGLTAFWFVYTSVLEGVHEPLEILRKVRNTCFGSIGEYYREFEALLLESEWAPEVAAALAGFDPGRYLVEFSFYEDADRRYRFLRDEVLGAARYHQATARLVERAGISLQELADGLWMDAACLRELAAEGHVLGLHSHTHPTRLEALPREAQRAEYARNREVLAGLAGAPPVVAAHPSNSYNQETLEVLRELGVVVGFRSNMSPAGGTPLELPRQDHVLVLREMGLR